MPWTSRPELCWIALRDIRPQQVTAFPAASFAQLPPVQLEAERLWCDGLILVRQLDVNDPPGRRAGLFPGGSQLDQHLVTGQLLLTQLMQALNQLLQPTPPHRLFFITTCATASQDVKLAVLFDEFHLNSIADLRPRLGEEVLFQSA